MGWPEEMRRGALLAAMIAGDSRLEGTAASLSERDSIRALGDALAPGGDRRELLEKLAPAVEPAVDVEAPSVPRARALLGRRAPRAVGERWLAEAPAVRRGFRPSLGLVRSIAHASGPTLPAIDDGAALSTGRTLLAAALRRTDESKRGALLAEISAGEAASLLALSAHDDRSAAPTPAMLVAASLSPGDARVAALGRVGRGAASKGGRVPRDPLMRAGRELAELGLAPSAEEDGWRA